MANITVPSFAALAPTPRPYAPQDNTLVNAVSSATDAITDVAKNWRTKEQSVNKANAVADYLEKEGMTQEAAAYRSAASNYQTNFFATPAENEKFNQSMVTDTIKLLSDKQARDIKRAELAEQQRYHTGIIDARKAEAGARDDNRQSIIEDRTARAEDREKARELQALGLMSGEAKAELDTYNKDIKTKLAEMDDIREAAALNPNIAQDPLTKKKWKDTQESLYQLYEGRAAFEWNWRNRIRRAAGEKPLPVRQTPFVMETEIPTTGRTYESSNEESSRAQEFFDSPQGAGSQFWFAPVTNNKYVRQGRKAVLVKEQRVAPTGTTDITRETRELAPGTTGPQGDPAGSSLDELNNAIPPKK